MDRWLRRPRRRMQPHNHRSAFAHLASLAQSLIFISKVTLDGSLLDSHNISPRSSRFHNGKPDYRIVADPDLKSHFDKHKDPQLYALFVD